VIVIYLISDPEIATFKILFKYYPVFELSVIFTILSTMLPYAIKGSNQCVEFDNQSIIVFMLSSFIILPVGFVLHPGDELYYKLYIDRSTSLYPYFLVWFFHGFINAIYTKIKAI
jgi:hypothetical protein